MKCLQCKEEFEGIRSTARFCCTKCKLAYHRKGISVSKDSVSDTVRRNSVSDTVKPVSVTEKKVSVSRDVTVKHCLECEKKDIVIAELKSLLEEVKKSMYSKKRSHTDLSDSPFSKARQVRRQGFDN